VTNLGGRDQPNSESVWFDIDYIVVTETALAELVAAQAYAWASLPDHSCFDGQHSSTQTVLKDDTQLAYRGDGWTAMSDDTTSGYFEGTGQ
jgi:hypothetical protein